VQPLNTIATAIMPNKVDLSKFLFLSVLRLFPAEVKTEDANIFHSPYSNSLLCDA
jgi:hypothetical protein